MPTYLDIISKKREIETLTDGSQHPFPSDMEDPDVKETDDYGLLIAKAIFYSNPSSGSSMFFNNRKEYQDYVNYALGEQSEDIYKPLLRIKPKESGTTFVGALNWAIKNYATKRVNIAVSKVSERIFDPQVDALDQNAVDQRERVRQKIKFYIDFREQNREIESILKEQLSPKEIDPSLLPNTSDELELWMNTGYKYAEGVVIEKLIMHHMDRNRYPNIKRMNAFDSFVLGVSCLFIGMDDNTLPEIYRCDPGDMIVPLTDREDFSDIGFAGHYMTPTIAEFYKMVGDSKSKDWVKEMVKRHGKTSPLAYYGPQTNTLGSVTDQTRMEIIRFAYKSTNEMVHVSKVDKFGNQRFLEKNYNEYKTPEDQEKFKKKYGDSRKLFRDKYYSVYGGFWIVSSDEVFRYGERYNQERPRGNLAESLLPFKFFAPNIKNNRTISTLKQMIPVLNELQAYHIKKQHVIANAIPAVWAIDLDALRSTDFKWNNKTMSDQDKIEFLFQSGIFAYGGADKRALPGSNWQPIRNLSNSVAGEIIMYSSQIQSTLMELDEIIGYNKVMAASTLRADTLKGTAEIQVRQSEIALDYLYRADSELNLEVIKTLGVLSRQSVKYKKGNYYEQIINKQEIELLKNSRTGDYGYRATLRPTNEKWQKLYEEAIGAVKDKEIGWDDYYDMKMMTTLKEAQNLFRVRVRQRRKEREALEKQKIEGNIQGQSMSNKQKHNNDVELKKIEIAIEKQKIDAEFRLESKKHRNKMDQIALEKRMEAGGDLLVAAKRGQDQIKTAVIKSLVAPTKTNGKDSNSTKKVAKNN